MEAIYRGDVETAGEEGRGILRPLPGEKVRFSCHPGIACFTECCADLCLMLTPYDIVRMKRRLGLTSGQFIEQHTELHGTEDPVTGASASPEKGRSLPLIRLRMKDDERRSCPFVKPEGCAIYEDRPGACRLYPFGRGAGSSFAGEEKEFYFVVSESHCLGFQEEKAWTVGEWIEDQGAAIYNEMNRAWMDVVTHERRGLGQFAEKKLAMFSMVSYDIDRFREFVFRTTFLEVFEISPEERRRIATDDVELMKLGMRWLGFALYGQGTMSLRKKEMATNSAGR